MMSISGKGASAAEGYYMHLKEDAHKASEAYRTEDYYSREGEGRWHGSGADALGLSGDVTKDDFSALVRGYSPSGAKLTQNAGAEMRRAGWDATFSAPKSVSITWGVSNDYTRSIIESAHDSAVNQALDYLEDRAIISRRGHGGITHESGEAVIAVFCHGTSREQDPQLHSHCFIMNAIHRSDETWGSLESRGLYLWQKAAGAIYRAELAERLRQAGYDVRRDGESFRINKVPKKLERDFSKRRQQIENELKKLGLSGAKASEKATLGTRQAKESINSQELRQQWQNIGLKAEYGPMQANPFIREERIYSIIPTPDTVLRIATENKAVLREQDIHMYANQAAQCAGMNAEAAENLASEAINQAVVLEQPETGQNLPILYTTEEMINIESEVLQLSVNNIDNRDHIVDKKTVQEAIAESEQRSGIVLSDEQLHAVEYLTTEPGSIRVLVGDAGTGKSASMEAVKISYQKSGYNLLGAAPSGKAAAGLEESTGTPSRTIDSLVNRIEKGQEFLSKNTVVILDEAGMVHSRSMHELVTRVHSAGAKLIAVGDHKQLQPVGAGTTFRHIANTEYGIGHTRISDIRRQRDDENKESVRELSRGEAAQAMLRYIDKGHVQIATTHNKAVNLVAEKYIDHYDNVGPQNVIGLASTTQRVSDINSAIRDALKQRGMLSDSKEFESIRKETVPGGARSYHDKADFATGDRIVYVDRNDYKNDIRRSDLGTVTKVTERGIYIRLDRTGDEHFVNPQDTDIRHGYAISTHRAQGMTVEHSVIYATNEAMSREMSYVQASRARDNTDWVTTSHQVDKMTEAIPPTEAMLSLADRLSDVGIATPLSDEQRESFIEVRNFLNIYSNYSIDTEQVPTQPIDDPRLAQFRQVVEAMSVSVQAESTLDYTVKNDLKTDRMKTADCDPSPL